MEKEFVFILGNARGLAAAELQSVLGQNQTASFNVSENLAFINSEMSEGEVKSLIDVLGGTVKIGVLVGQGDPVDIISDNLRSYLARDVGFSYYKSKVDRDRLFEIKNKLKGEGIKIRLVLPKKNNVLNAAEIRANKLVGKGREYLICGDKVYRTIAVQDIEEISQRDFGKPKSNAFSGMLPPKLARMMVNIAAAAAQDQISNIKNQKLLVVDPFCGSGNILIEAMDLGYRVLGSDISEKAVAWTGENLEWFAKIKGSHKGFIGVAKGDATKDDFLKGVMNPFVVVTEPFLGKPKKDKVEPSAAERELDQLSKLYLGFLENLANLSNLRRLSRLSLCLVFPVFELKNGGQAHLWDRIVDKISSLGYIELAGPFLYGRSYSIVKREIVLFKLT